MHMTVLDEGLVDLELLQRQAFQISQGRVTSTKIIQRQLNTQVAQLMHALGGLVDIAYHHAFGDLQRQMMRVGASVFQNAFELVDKIHLAELVRADIDRQPQAPDRKLWPRQQDTSLAQHPVA